LVEEGPFHEEVRSRIRAYLPEARFFNAEQVARELAEVLDHLAWQP
jgi:hypothetical protein